MTGAKRKSLLIAAVVLAVIAAIAVFATTTGPFAPVKVSVAAAERTTLKRSAFGIGTVEARLAYSVGPTQAGRVLKMRVDHGDEVSAGDVLAELDPVDLAERLAGGEAALARAAESVRAAEAQVRETESRDQVARANAKRYQDLAQKGFVSRELADARLNDANITRAAVDGANASLAAARRDGERLARERDAIAKQVGNLKLIAPVSAVVVARLAEPGTAIVAGQAVLRLVDPASLWVRARVDQARAGGIRVGDAAQIVLRSREGTLLHGRVARIDIQSDAVTEERLVSIEFNERPAGLSLGELCEVTVAQSDLANALVVPSAAVKSINRRPGVWRVEDGRARFHPVRTGVQTLEGRTEVLAGLEAGDQVIVHSSAQLAEGMRVAGAGGG